MSRRYFVVAGAGLVGSAALWPLATGAERTTGQGKATPDASPIASPQASPAASAEVVIEMTLELRFNPDDLAIRSGTTVRWINASPMPHTATGDPEQNPVAATNPEYITLPDGAEPWGSALLQPGDTYTHTFTTPGEYRYICIPHVMSGMRGTIRVER
jgi:plastocyanin